MGVRISIVDEVSLESGVRLTANLLGGKKDIRASKRYECRKKSSAEKWGEGLSRKDHFTG